MSQLSNKEKIEDLENQIKSLQNQIDTLKVQDDIINKYFGKTIIPEVIDVLECRAVKELLTNVDLETEAIWSIYGEDPNCDFGGHHSNPFLGKVKGPLWKVIEHVSTLSNFFTWGSGGNIIMSKEEKIINL